MFNRPRTSDRGYCSTPSTAQTVSVCGGELRRGSVAISRDEYRSLQRMYGFVNESSRPRPEPPAEPKRKDFPADRDGYRAFDDAMRQYRSAYASWEAWTDPRPFFQAGADVSMLRYAEVDGIRIVAWLARVMRGTAPGADPLKAVVQLAIDAGWDVDPADVSWAKNDEPSEEFS